MDGRRQERVDILRKAVNFSHLPPETLQRLAAGASESVFRRGNVVFGRGSAATGIYIAAAGQLKLTLDTQQGAEHVVELIQERDSFGEAALLSNRPHMVTAIAVTDCRLLHIGRLTVIAELERDIELARRMLGTLSDRLYRQTGEMENALFLKATGRVARFILECLKTHGAPNGGNGQSVALPVRKGLIASHLHMTQEHFSRTLRELTSTGLIRVNGVHVDVIEIDKLRDAAGMVLAPRCSSSVV